MDRIITENRFDRIFQKCMTSKNARRHMKQKACVFEKRVRGKLQKL